MTIAAFSCCESCIDVVTLQTHCSCDIVNGNKKWPPRSLMRHEYVKSSKIEGKRRGKERAALEKHGRADVKLRLGAKVTSSDMTMSSQSQLEI